MLAKDSLISAWVRKVCRRLCFLAKDSLMQRLRKTDFGRCDAWKFYCRGAINCEIYIKNHIWCIDHIVTNGGYVRRPSAAQVQEHHKFECQTPVDLARLGLIDSSLTGQNLTDEPKRWRLWLSSLRVAILKHLRSTLEAPQDRPTSYQLTRVIQVYNLTAAWQCDRDRLVRGRCPCTSGEDDGDLPNECLRSNNSNEIAAI